MGRRLLATTLVGLMVLAGCGGEPSEEPTKTASPSPTKTTPDAPDVPAAAKENTKEGAEAFVRHYVSLVNRAQESGEVGPLISASDPDCGSCDGFVRRAQEIYGSGGNVTGGAWNIDRLVVIGESPALPGWTLAADITFGPQTVTEGDPPRTEKFDGGKTFNTFHVAWHRNAWRMADITRGE